MRINVTKSYLPPLEEYSQYLKLIWTSSQLTNNGQLVQTLEQRLIKRLVIPNLLYMSNGTIPLQIAIKALGIKKKIITTPFSYVATVNTILWEGCEPIFVDIDPNTLCIDASKIEAMIDDQTEAILAVHVYGNPCDVKTIERIANKYKLKVIYDAAHAFGVKYKNKSILSYGDISTLSFHATKVFHTGEGGALIAQTADLHKKAFLMRQFGHYFDSYETIGINGKNSELHAAMGLAVLDNFDKILHDRKNVVNQYDILISEVIQRPIFPLEATRNYSYYPILLRSEEELMKIVVALESKKIFPRRYFYPSLNKLDFIENKQSCPISEDISRRVLCLPLYTSLTQSEVSLISEIVNNNIIHI